MWPTAPRLVDRLREVAVHVEAPADAGLGAVRPGEHAVGPPDLDRHERAVVPELVGQPGGGVAGDLHLAAPDELAAQHAVDVLGDARAAVGDRLVGDRPGQGGAEQDPAHRDDARAREQEDAQQRHRPLGGRPQIRTGSSQESQLHGSRIRYRIAARKA